MQSNPGIWTLPAGTPFGIEYEFAFVRAAIEGERLGGRGVTDMMALSVSSTDFIGHTFGIRVARVALYKFLKKYGLQDSPAPAPAAGRPALGADQPAGVTPLGPALLPPPLPAAVAVVPQGQPIPTPAPPFSPRGRSTRRQA